ncbi:MAG: hypothetical protein H6R04_2003 [Burkholderiaceae bacterium]|nr:hypothetical protein [Burkholderiaceae bacterium]
MAGIATDEGWSRYHNGMTNPTLLQLIGAAIFGLAVLHTFLTSKFEHLAHGSTRHAGIWHLLGEVEVVFGFWALVLVLAMASLSGTADAVAYLDSRNFTEPLFVFVILVIAATRPVLYLTKRLVDLAVRVLPLAEPLAYYLIILTLVPLLGSFITEPAAMTLAALMLRDRYYRGAMSSRLQYGTLGVLFVNVSIGGVLTPFAAPPVLIVASKWGWDIGFMLTHFGWKAAIAVGINAVLATLLFARELMRLNPPAAANDANYEANHSDAANDAEQRMPPAVVLIHLLFLAGTVAFSHHPAVFMGLFLFFLGYTQAYRRHQDPLLLREGLLVAFFLAGLIVIGGLQQWWLQPLLGGIGDSALFLLAASLTALTDNAALTYLGSLVEGLSASAKYALVAGAVTGGGLTVIANAPNPAGFALLKNHFHGQAISPLGLLLAALVPTLVAAACFVWL